MFSVPRDQASGEWQRIFQVVSDHHDRLAARADYLPQVFVKLFAPTWIEFGGRLVENQQLRFHGQDAGQGNPLYLTAGQAVRTPLFEPVHSNLSEALGYPVLNGSP